MGCQNHIAPNNIDIDPDVDISVLAYSEEQAYEKKGVARFIVKYQTYFWFPLLTITAFSKRFSLFRILMHNLVSKRWKSYVTDLTFLMVGTVLLYGLIFHFLGISKGVVFVLVNQALVGLYLGTIFATNHKAMPLMKEEIGFTEAQILTTRSVKANPLISFWCVGLNYQIEHHLFPTMPRNNFAKAQKIVKPFCNEIGIEYYETGFFQSYKEILQNFHNVSAVLRKPKVVGLAKPVITNST